MVSERCEAKAKLRDPVARDFGISVGRCADGSGLGTLCSGGGNVQRTHPSGWCEHCQRMYLGTAEEGERSNSCSRLVWLVWPRKKEENPSWCRRKGMVRRSCEASGPGVRVQGYRWWANATSYVRMMRRTLYIGTKMSYVESFIQFPVYDSLDKYESLPWVYPRLTKYTFQYLEIQSQWPKENIMKKGSGPLITSHAGFYVIGNAGDAVIWLAPTYSTSPLNVCPIGPCHIVDHVPIERWK